MKAPLWVHAVSIVTAAFLWGFAVSIFRIEAGGLPTALGVGVLYLALTWLLAPAKPKQ
jgi:hypothetical protein